MSSIFFLDPADKQKSDIHESLPFSNETAVGQLYRANKDARVTFIHLHFFRMISDRNRCTSIAHSCITLQERACLRFARAHACIAICARTCGRYRAFARSNQVRIALPRFLLETRISNWDTITEAR